MQHIILHVAHSVASPLIVMPFSERTTEELSKTVHACATDTFPPDSTCFALHALLAHAARDWGERVGQAGQPQSALAPVAPGAALSVV